MFVLTLAEMSMYFYPVAVTAEYNAVQYLQF